MSPLRLVQERVSHDLHYPWRVIACCALLQRTQGAQVRPMLVELFRGVWPAPEAVLRVSARDLLEPLGLFNRREQMIRRMTWDYLSGAQPEDCFGVGAYGRDAVALFVHGVSLSPGIVTDRWLKPYAEWRRGGGKAPEWDAAGHSAWREGQGFAPMKKSYY